MKERDEHIQIQNNIEEDGVYIAIVGWKMKLFGRFFDDRRRILLLSCRLTNKVYFARRSGNKR